MKPTVRLVAIVVAAACMTWFTAGDSSIALEKRGATTRTQSATADDRTNVSLTIYNVNLGLVKDQRRVRLSPGFTDLRFMDVASKIIPTSVHIRSLADPDSLQVLEQNYEYDLLNPQKLLDKYVGKEVKLYTKNPFTEQEELVTATLLSNNGQPVFRIGDEITFSHPGRILFPGIPENLNSKPTLVWMLQNDLSKDQQIEASYLTNGINWRSDYVLTLNDRDDTADLSAWVTIDNQSGTSYANARLKLVAGDVNRVKDKAAYDEGMMRFAAKEARAASAPQFTDDSFFEYHLYTLERPTTVRDNQTKQISLVSAKDIPVRKELIFRGAPYYYYGQYAEISVDQKIGVFVEFENRESHNLGIPLPKGTVRVYKADSEASLQFVGEDSIDHTPKEEKIRIKLGDAFDVKASRKMTDWKKLMLNRYEAEYEISLRNHKKEDIVIRVVEPIPGDWSMITSSHDWKKTEAFTAEFSVPVPKDQEVKLTYRVRMKY